MFTQKPQQTDSKSPAKPRALSFYMAALGGAVIETGLHPIDTVTKRLQKHPGKFQFSQEGIQEFKQVAFPANRSILDGFAPSLTYRLIQRGTMFGSQPLVQAQIDNTFGASIASLVGDQYRATTTHTLAAGSLGVVETIFLPIDFIKVKRQLGGTERIKAIIASETIPSLFRGIGPTITRNVLGFGSLYAGSELVKKFYYHKNINDPVTLNEKMTSSLVGSIVATLATSAPDVVKTRVQDSKARTTGRKVLREILATNPSALWKGLGPRLFAVAPRFTVIKTASEHLAPIIDHAIDTVSGP